ncbi:MAG: hypothetical protein ACRENE_25075 [Polyangiaceae bacterium]
MANRKVLTLALAGIGAVGCDKSGPLAELDAGGTWVTAPSASASAASTARPAPVEAGRAMPPRPVPITSPTVRVTMPIDVQLQAIQYMAAMQAPQPSDPPIDTSYAKDLAEKLRPVGKVDVISSGRLIDVHVGKCTDTLPKESISRYGGNTITGLFPHGILVVRCTDKEVQCLQSTRDADDVLCAHK